MSAFKPSKVTPYSPTRPHPVRTRPPANEDTEDESNRYRKELAPSLLQCCICPCAFLAGSALLILLAVVVVVPLVVSLKNSSDTTKMTMSPSATVTTTSTTTSTTAILCMPSCASQEICVLGRCLGIGYLSFTMTWSRKGDGDIVVKTPNANVIFYNNTGPSALTDQGALDIDDRNGTGPENVFWSNSRPLPPAGVYYVCFEPYLFNSTITISNPISVTLTVKGSNNSTSTATRNFTSPISNDYKCDASSPTLLLTYSYP